MAYRCHCNIKHCYDSICLSTYGCFNLRQIYSNGTIKIIIGCLQKLEDINSICNNTTLIKSCCKSDLCNNNATSLKLPKSSYDGNYIYQLMIKIFVPIIALILIFCLILIYKYHRRISKYLKIYSGLSTTVVRPRCDESYFKPYIDGSDATSISQNNGSRFIDNYSGLLPLAEGQYGPGTEGQCDSCTSGSGSGMPFLVQRTIARQVQLIAGIGKGRFGEVWRGEYYGELVAVKIFSSRDETSWARETHIYNTFLLRHPNILGYYASDMVSRYGCTQLWLITHYHSLGSLYDHLHEASFTLDCAMALLHSIVAGLAHLHKEIVTGPHGKPRIAHRDLKSKNILMIDHATACIADLGLSVLQSSVHCLCPLPSYNKHKVGTKRYMSPEILADCLCPDTDESSSSLSLANGNATSANGSVVYSHDCPITFDQFISSDIYSLALVMWEVLSRTELGPQLPLIVADYRVPFYDCLPLDPSTDDMKKVVCIDKIRPSFPIGPLSRANCLFSLVRECWTEKCQSRPSALRIKKNLKSLLCDPNYC